MAESTHPDARCHWCGEAFVQRTIEQAEVWICPTARCAQRQWNHAVRVRVKGGTRLVNLPTPKAVDFETCKAPNRLFGGAAGGAKSHEMRWGLYRDCLRLPNLECLIVRQTFPELERTHLRRMARDAPLIGAVYHETKRLMTFSNGSFVEAGHLDDDKALQKFLSTEYDRIRIDEASRTPGEILLELASRARTPIVADKRAILAEGGANVGLSSNPGGPGAQTLLDFFIDQTPDFDAFPGLAPGEPNAYDPAQWAFIPAKLSDNPYMSPSYRRTLAGLPRIRRQQLEDGDWRVFTGQFFPEWSETTHVRRINGRLHDLRVFGSLDWGYNSCGACYWWVCLPDGHFHISHEYKFNGPVAEKLTVKDVSAELIRRSHALDLRKCPTVYADPAVTQHTGQVGESILETFQRNHVPMVVSNNDRVNGWQRVHELLRLAPDGIPWLTIDPSCRYLIRTIAAAVQDASNPDDLDTNTDDHALDALRYGAMSRPAASHRIAPSRIVPGSLADWTRERFTGGVLSRRTAHA